MLYGKINGRPVAALLANARRGLGKAFLDQENKKSSVTCHAALRVTQIVAPGRLCERASVIAQRAHAGTHHRAPSGAL
jgi:hypothetical protein